jgi:hypothetical protein
MKIMRKHRKKGTKKGQEKVDIGQQKARNHEEPRTGPKYKKETH